MKESTRNLLITLFVSAISTLITTYLIKDENVNIIDHTMLYLLTWLVVFTCFKFIIIDSKERINDSK